jgi:hypothetical protein
LEVLIGEKAMKWGNLRLLWNSRSARQAVEKVGVREWSQCAAAEMAARSMSWLPHWPGRSPDAGWAVV